MKQIGPTDEILIFVLPLLCNIPRPYKGTLNCIGKYKIYLSSRYILYGS